MDSQTFIKRYSEIANLIEKEFERNREKYGNKIKCSRGCSQCCHQIFNITLIDEYVIRKSIINLPELQRNTLKSKAKNYIANFKTVDFKSEEYSKTPGIPCPALGEKGECTIYEGRPLICRRFGPPIFDYKNPTHIYSCELNFKSGEEIFDDNLIPNQTKIGKLWDNFKTEFNSELPINTRTSTTIAEAILNS